MKKQQKKAFTLVELLVVIAILAILSTVAVVGYTSFIKRAAISNDESVVTQLNRYLEALKADSSSEFYGQEIHAGNIREITAHILKEGGMNELNPEAAKYGYDFYFDLEDGFYKSLDADTVDRPDKGRAFFGLNAGAIGSNGGYEVRLENSFTKDNRYFLVSTAGEVANLIREFYALGDSTTPHADIESLVERSEDTVLKNFVNNAVIVTDGLNYRLSSDPKYVVIVDNVKFIAPSAQTWNGSDWDIAKVYDRLAAVDSITLPESVKAIENGALNLKDADSEIYTTKTTTALAALAAGSFTNGKIVNHDDVVYKAGVTHIESKDGELLARYSSQYALQEIKIESASQVVLYPTSAAKKVDVVNSIIQVPAEITGFDIRLSFVGSIDDEIVLGADIVTWEGGEDYLDYTYNIETDTLSATFKVDTSTITEPFTIKAKSGAVEKTFTIYVEDITDGTVEFAGHTLTNGSTNDITVIKTTTIDNYPITKKNFTYVHDIAELCDETFNLTYTGTGAEIKDGKLKLTGNGTGTLTVKIGTDAYTYLSYTVNLTVADTSNFALQPKNGNNFTVLGNENTIKLSDLFELKGDIPAGAEVVVFTGARFNGDDYMTPVRAELPESDDALTVNDARQVVSNDNYANVAFTFTGADTVNTIRIAVIHNGVRISEDVEVNIVNALNVRTYVDLTATLSSGNFTKNIVLLDNLTMTTDVNTFNIGSTYTLYGNGYTLDIKNGRLSEEGIINLKGGTIRDIKIVGKVYADTAFRAGDEYGSAAVNATGNAKIINSYLANTRSPLRTSGNTTIKDSVLFGGRYANIDMTGGTVTIEGTVTTVQQLYSISKESNGGLAASNIIGLGISAWFNDSKKFVNIADDAELIQYNFLDYNIRQHLPKIGYMGYDVMETKEPFESIFNNTSRYGDYIFTSGGNKYVNSGLAATDMYMFDYDVTGSPSKSSWGSKVYAANKDIKTVKVTTSGILDTEEFIIAYDTRFTPQQGEVITAGKVKVTGAQLKAGVQFLVNTDINVGILAANDYTGYLFQIQSQDYLTINPTGNSDHYAAESFLYSKDLGSILAIIEKLGVSFHDSGIHYHKMSVGVNTVKNDNVKYQQYLQNYINMGNFYYPENYQFVGGNIVNYSGK